MRILSVFKHICLSILAVFSILSPALGGNNSSVNTFNGRSYRQIKEILAAEGNSESKEFLPPESRRIQYLFSLSEVVRAEQYRRTRNPVLKNSIPVFIARSEIMNAYAVTREVNDDRDNFVDAIVITDSFMDAVPDEISLKFVLAHELGHIAFRDALSPVHQHVVYSSSPNNLYGFRSNVISSIGRVEGDLTITGLINHGYRDSILTDIEIGGFPLSKKDNTWRFLAKAKNVSGSNCDFSSADTKKIVEARNYFKYLRVFDTPNSELLREFIEDLSHVADKMDICIKSAFPRLGDQARQFAETYGDRSERMMEIIYEANQKIKDRPYDSILTEIMGLRSLSHKEIRAAENSLSSREVRFATTEDRADRYALLTMMSLGLSASSGVSGLLEVFYKKAFTRDTSPLLSRCHRMVENGTEPPFGSYGDRHHNMCWRFFRITQIEKLIKKHGARVLN